MITGRSPSNSMTVSPMSSIMRSLIRSTSILTLSWRRCSSSSYGSWLSSERTRKCSGSGVVPSCGVVGAGTGAGVCASVGMGTLADADTLAGVAAGAGIGVDCGADVVSASFGGAPACSVCRGTAGCSAGGSMVLSVVDSACASCSSTIRASRVMSASWRMRASSCMSMVMCGRLAMRRARSISAMAWSMTGMSAWASPPDGGAFMSCPKWWCRRNCRSHTRMISPNTRPARSVAYAVRCQWPSVVHRYERIGSMLTVCGSLATRFIMP